MNEVQKSKMLNVLGIVQIDAHGKVLFMNEAAKSLLGCDYNQVVIGKPIQELIGYSKILEALKKQQVIENEHCIVRFVNSSYSRIRGIPKEDIVGRKLQTVRTGQLVSEAIKSGKPRLDIHKKFGNEEYIVSVMPLICNDGNIIGAISVSQEIQRVKRLIEKCQSSGISLKQFDSRNDVFAEANYTFSHIITQDKKFQAVLERARRVANTDCSVLICGESGTGKEMLAQAIHNASYRREKYFVAVNCAAIPEDLLESELFGYEPGAFTGARAKGKMGLFEIANGGTLFLDEIGDMSLTLQAKLLRVLQEGKIRHLGGTRETKVNVRVIAATNKNLEKMLQEGQFREDLYYRLNEIPINIPPLRHRPLDIPLLVDYFLQKLNKERNTSISISRRALEVLQAHSWPGNVRELKNALTQFYCNIHGTCIVKNNHIILTSGRKFP
ncbi:MAG: hypothetical protein PWP65_91 [Clostridia bacterium]|nr:hypothetical protein [Clostridia bacterium]